MSFWDTIIKNGGIMFLFLILFTMGYIVAYSGIWPDMLFSIHFNIVLIGLFILFAAGTFLDINESLRGDR